MGEISGIAWTDATFNPWWGCTRVSPGCDHCYAETLATVRRKLTVWGVDAPRKAMSEDYWRDPLKWNRKAAEEGVRRRVFCASMADVFERVSASNVVATEVMAAGRARLWPTIRLTPSLDWLLLTKRPQNVVPTLKAEIARIESSLAAREGRSLAGDVDERTLEWIRRWLAGDPPSNVWLGVTAEDQARADQRIPTLLQIPAAIRFVSHEPALEHVDFSSYFGAIHCGRPIDWIITGGESGPGARPYDAEWARSVIQQCATSGAAAFVKQLGSNPHDSARSIVGGREPGDPEPDTRMPGISGKGGDLDEWPANLRVQEFPRPRSAA